MTYRNVTCPLCRLSFKVHGHSVGLMMRSHLRMVHPKADEEISAFEAKMREERKALRDKYGKEFSLFV